MGAALDGAGPVTIPAGHRMHRIDLKFLLSPDLHEAPDLSAACSATLDDPTTESVLVAIADQARAIGARIGFARGGKPRYESGASRLCIVLLYPNEAQRLALGAAFAQRLLTTLRRTFRDNRPMSIAL